MQSHSANNSCNTLFVKLLQSMVITAKHLMRTNCIWNLQFQTSKHKSVREMHAWYLCTERKETPYFTNAEWFYKFLHQCNYYDFRLLTSSSMPGNWIFVSDASDGCTNTKKIKCLYYKHIRRTVPQNGIPTAICTSKHSVLMIVCHNSSHDSNWNSKPKIELQWLPWKQTIFYIYSGRIPFFPIIFNIQIWEDIMWIIL